MIIKLTEHNKTTVSCKTIHFATDIASCPDGALR